VRGIGNADLITTMRREADGMTTATEAGQAGLQGWRAKVADGIAEPVADRTGLSEDQVRALIGAAFFVLSVVYVANTVKALAQRKR
jgi:hypothetical protein